MSSWFNVIGHAINQWIFFTQQYCFSFCIWREQNVIYLKKKNESIILRLSLQWSRFFTNRIVFYYNTEWEKDCPEDINPVHLAWINNS